ncbi:MAG: helix-turn-helix transcriptional regulator [Solirubrobacterales bacterium]|nr:helix-turn-helix transcriptional regulator [Solirubrobacterales bacterium]
MPKGIQKLLRELRRDRGWSRELLSHHAFGIDQHGTSVALIAAIERGERHASARTMLALAAALDVSPECFPEFRLAIARIALDERVVGLDGALGRLEASELEPIDITKDQIRAGSRRAAAPSPGPPR